MVRIHECPGSRHAPSELVIVSRSSLHCIGWNWSPVADAVATGRDRNSPAVTAMLLAHEHWDAAARAALRQGDRDRPARNSRLRARADPHRPTSHFGRTWFARSSIRSMSACQRPQAPASPRPAASASVAGPADPGHQPGTLARASANNPPRRSHRARPGRPTRQPGRRTSTCSLADRARPRRRDVHSSGTIPRIHGSSTMASTNWTGRKGKRSRTSMASARLRLQPCPRRCRSTNAKTLRAFHYIDTYEPRRIGADCFTICRNACAGGFLTTANWNWTRSMPKARSSATVCASRAYSARWRRRNRRRIMGAPSIRPCRTAGIPVAASARRRTDQLQCRCVLGVPIGAIHSRLLAPPAAAAVSSTRA